jgi:hypothetical protein
VIKRPGRGVDHPPASSADVKESVELYLYSLYDMCGTTSPEENRDLLYTEQDC